MLQLATMTNMPVLDRHRARHVRGTPSLNVMRRANPNGTPLRLLDLTRLTGFSKPKIIGDIRAGYLGATRDPRSGIWLVPFGEAQRYLRALGIL